MPKYKVIKTFKYTETVVVEAANKHDAEELATMEDGECNGDDWLFDCEATKIDEA